MSENLIDLLELEAIKAEADALSESCSALIRRGGVPSRGMSTFMAEREARRREEKILASIHGSRSLAISFGHTEFTVEGVRATRDPRYDPVPVWFDVNRTDRNILEEIRQCRKEERMTARRIFVEYRQLVGLAVPNAQLSVETGPPLGPDATTIYRAVLDHIPPVAYVSVPICGILTQGELEEADRVVDLEFRKAIEKMNIMNAKAASFVKVWRVVDEEDEA